MVLLQECDRSPEQVATEKEIALIVEGQIKEIHKLRDNVAVMTHAREADAKREKTIAVERHREREELKREIAKHKVTAVWVRKVVTHAMCSIPRTQAAVNCNNLHENNSCCAGPICYNGDLLQNCF